MDPNTHPQPLNNNQQQEASPPISSPTTPPTSPSQNASNNSPPGNSKKKLIIFVSVFIIIFLIIIAVAGIYLSLKSNDISNSTNKSLENSDSFPTSSTNSDELNQNSKNPNWIKFINVERGYSIEYPRKVSVYCDENSICEIGNNSNQITIIPFNLYNSYNELLEDDPEYVDDDTLTELNEEKDFYQILFNADPLEKIKLDSEFTIERLEDIRLGTTTAKAFKSSPDPFDKSILKIYIISSDDEIFIISMYTSDEDLPEEIVDKIISSFRLEDNTINDKITSDLTKNLGDDFRNTEIKYVWGNWAEGITYSNEYEELYINDEHRFYAMNKDGKWNIVWKSLFDSEYEDSCQNAISRIDNLPQEVDCFFDDYPDQIIPN